MNSSSIPIVSWRGGEPDRHAYHAGRSSCPLALVVIRLRGSRLPEPL
jgi:hypothetical protein